MAAVGLGTKAVSAGGRFTEKGLPSRWIDVYDVVTRQWQRGQLTRPPSASPVAVALSDRVLVTNGRDVEVFVF